MNIMKQFLKKIADGAIGLYQNVSRILKNIGLMFWYRFLKPIVVPVTILVVFALILAALHFFVDNEPITPKQEKQLAIILTVIFFCVFMVLYMIRNAIVANSLFLAHFKDSLSRNGKTLDAHEKATKQAAEATLGLTKKMEVLHKDFDLMSQQLEAQMKENLAKKK